MGVQVSPPAPYIFQYLTRLIPLDLTFLVAVGINKVPSTSQNTGVAGQALTPSNNLKSDTQLSFLTDSTVLHSIVRPP